MASVGGRKSPHYEDYWGEDWDEEDEDVEVGDEHLAKKMTCIEILHNEANDKNTFVLSDEFGITEVFSENRLYFGLARDIVCDNIVLNDEGYLEPTSAFKPDFSRSFYQKDLLNLNDFCSYLCLNRGELLGDIDWIDEDMLNTEFSMRFLSKKAHVPEGVGLWKGYHSAIVLSDNTPWDVCKCFRYGFYGRTREAIHKSKTSDTEKCPMFATLFTQIIFYDARRREVLESTEGFQFSKSAFNRAACDYITSLYSQFKREYYSIVEVKFFTKHIFECDIDDIYAHKDDLLTYFRFRVLTDEIDK